MFGHIRRHHRRRTRRHAGKHALFARHFAHKALGIFLVHIPHFIHQVRLKNARHIFGRPAAYAGNRRFGIGLQTDDFHMRVLRFQIFGHTSDGAGGAHGAHKMGDFAFGLRPDFGAGGEIVRLLVVGIVELIEHQALARSLHRQRLVARGLHAVGFNQLGAISGHRIFALLRGIFRHQQNQPIAAHGRHHGQRNAGVAAGGFNQGVARADSAALFGLHNHIERGAVFHRAGRIVALKLGPHLRLRVRGHTLQADKRGVADAIGQGLNRLGHVVCRVNVKQAQVITKPPARI